MSWRGRYFDWMSRLLKKKPKPVPPVPPVPPPPVVVETHLPQLWCSDGFTAGVGDAEKLLNDSAAMRASSINFQASADQWMAAFLAARGRGFHVELWAACTQIDPARLRELLEVFRPERFTAQIEGEDELAAFRRFHEQAVFVGTHLDIVIIGPVSATGAEFRQRGVQRTWCEAYLQDGREPNDMCRQAEVWWDYPSPLPLIGCYSGVGPSAYDLSRFGRGYGVWRWEQCDPAWYAEMP